MSFNNIEAACVGNENMTKFDICSAYHFIDIELPDTEHLAFSFPDQKGASHYHKFLVLPFGLGVGPYIFSKLTLL